MKKNTVLAVSREQELLPFLQQELRGQSRNNIKSLLTWRQVHVDGKPVGQHDFALRPGMVVEILWNQPRGAQPDELPILFEDENMIAIDKPAGLLTIATERERERTAYRMLTEYVRRGDPNARIFVVHRLDRDTSGVWIVAKSEQAKRALQDAWNDRVLRREYLAVVEGCPEEARGTIRSRLRETKTHLVYSAERGVSAVTNYELLRRGTRYSLLRVEIETGRKNQIRVHMHDLGHPIAGDRKYGAASSPIGRLALHASTLALKSPFSGEVLTLTARMPKAFERLLRL